MFDLPSMSPPLCFLSDSNSFSLRLAFLLYFVLNIIIIAFNPFPPSGLLLAFKIRRPALGQRNQIGTIGCGLEKGDAIRTEHDGIFAAPPRRGAGSVRWIRSRRCCDR